MKSFWQLNWHKKRRLVLLYKKSENYLDALGLLLIVGFCIFLFPKEVLNDLPATGGDTGSHFWPLSTLVKYGIPHGLIKIWNPGNMGGEPHFVHYFPFPFLWMAFLSIFMPLGKAFNVGSAMALPMLPLASYFCIRSFGFRFPAALFAAAFSLIFIFNESYTMWGGNSLSLLAGTFAQSYALVLLLFGLGFFALELRKNRKPVFSTLLFSAVAFSHAYVFLTLPSFLVAFVLFFKVGSFKQRFWNALISFCGSVFLSAWFLIPMVDNSKWTTPYNPVWTLKEVLNEGTSSMLYPILLWLPTIVLVFWKKKKLRSVLYFLSIPMVFCAVFYFIAPHVGVVNIRVLPVLMLLLLLFTGIFLVLWLRKLLGGIGLWILIMPIILLTIGWTNLYIKNFPVWAKWNYSGWQSKGLYPSLMQLSDAIRGNFSMPRVVYEHNDLNEQAGTVRVFEMLPYFTNRATLESVYMQSTILAPMVFHIQAMVSSTPSCPFPGQECPAPDLNAAIPKLNVMGVGSLILATDAVEEQAKKINSFQKKGNFGPWRLYDLLPQPVLVENFRETPEFIFHSIEDASYKASFLRWFKAYNGSQRFIVNLEGKDTEETGSPEFKNKWATTENCNPTVEVDYNHITLTTQCPGKAHLLKFAYHPSWKANTGDTIFLVSPGMMGLIPSQNKVELTFGQRGLWVFANVISICSFIGLIYYGIRRKKWKK